MREVYVVQYWEEDTDFVWQIYAVTTSKEYAKDCSRMLQDREDVAQAGYETHGLVEMGVMVEEN